MISSILRNVMGGGRGRRRPAGGAGMGAPGGQRGGAGASKDAAIGRGVRSLFRRVR